MQNNTHDTCKYKHDSDESKHTDADEFTRLTRPSMYKANEEVPLCVTSDLHAFELRQGHAVLRQTRANKLISNRDRRPI